MSDSKKVAVKDLRLDLRNYRTVPQKSEARAVHAFISISPDRFWALMESLLSEGFHDSANLLVLKADDGKALTVKEGNRRVGALKLILGLIKPTGMNIPSHIAAAIANLPADWKNDNSTVPCTIYEPAEVDKVNRQVSLTHGKDEKAARENWNSVARARHAREENGQSEPGLDLLEKYLKHGENLTDQQKERWAGDFNLTVLDEAIKRLAPRVAASSAQEFANNYPKLAASKVAVDDLLLAIGMGQLGFEDLRSKERDFGEKFGFPSASASPSTGAGSSASAGSAGAASGGTSTAGASSGSAGGAATAAGQTAAGGATKKPGASAKAYGLQDQRSVIQSLKQFWPRGANRAKVVTLVGEAKNLNLTKNPIAFCFLLRSMFEISAKAYCDDLAGVAGAPTAKKASGEDRKLVEVLRDITDYMTKANAPPGKVDKNKQKLLHGAMTELASEDRLLSVTSMNQLVHHTKFSLDERHICQVFHNIFPLLEEMNR